jgi:Holliday junction resolvase RusA-like endonuclease
MLQQAATPTQAPTPMTLTFTVPGEAVPQGSMKAFTPKGWKRPIITGDNPRTKPWRSMVQAAAIDAQYATGTWPAISDRPIRLEIECAFVRPASVSERKRPLHTVKPDIDKLLRNLNDALTKILWRDDAQIVSVSITKSYASALAPAHTTIQVREIVITIPGLSRLMHKTDLPGGLLPLIEDSHV